MHESHSITRWIDALKRGDDRATRVYWDRFFEQLSGIARRKLGATSRRSRDEEDLALSALNALFVGAKEGRFQRLESRDDVWQLLTLILSRKVSNLRRWNLVRKEVSVTDLASDPQAAIRATLEQAIAGVSTEEGIDSLGVECDELLALLDPRLCEVALLKLSGHSNEEIARILQRSVKTIERWLRTIRLSWSEALEREESSGSLAKRNGGR